MLVGFAGGAWEIARALLTIQARPDLDERTIGSRIDLPQASHNELVLGYGRALAEILAQLASELGTIENSK